MEDETSQIEQRIKRYWYRDGIGEMMGGVMFLVLAGYFSLQQYLGDESFIGGILQAGLVLLLIGGMYVGRRVVNSAKARITYPRTGYVEYRTNSRNAVLMRILAAFTAMAVASMSVFVARKFDSIDAMVAVTGVLVAVILMVKQGWGSGLGRFYFLSAASLVLGGILSVSGFARGYNLGLFYALMGTAFLISGGLILKRYLNENPLPVEAGMSSDLRGLADLDRLIHEPARLLIVTILAAVESADFLFLQRETGLTKGNLSAHLSKLEEAGYVKIEKTFKGKLPLTVCKLTAKGQKAYTAYRQQMQSFMDKTS